MKVYAAPENIAKPNHDYSKPYNHNEDERYKAEIKAWLLSHGYTGKYTGEVVRFPYADSYAEYMLADGKKSFLVHLQICDAWDDPNAQYVPKKEIIRRIEQAKNIAKLFSKQ